MAKKQQHAKRNADLAKLLVQGGIYFDWAVTTSFYSAIHLVELKLLPTKLGGSTCNNIEDVKRHFRSKSRHQAREKLVLEKKPIIYPKYKWLDDRSRNSRYITYKVSKQIAEKALQYLKEIESAL